MTNAVNIAQSGSNNQTMRNRIINGAMTIDQRNNGAAITLSNTNQFPVDRFVAARDTSGATCTAQRSTVVPPNYVNSLLWTTTTGSSPASGNDNIMYQYIEGFNVADFGWGTANAQPFTLSFWVRSSLTGTYGVSFANSDNSRCFMGTYTVSAANTWEFKTITVPGDTTGTWLTNNGIGLRIFWDMGSGTSRSIAASSSWGASFGTGLTGGVKVVATTGATFYITGVQLEEGTAASPFENRLIGTELSLCQRYYQVIQNTGAGTGVAPSDGGFISLAAFDTTNAYGPILFQQTMRASPTISLSDTPANTIALYWNGTGADCDSFVVNNTSVQRAEVLFSATSNYTAGNAVWARIKQNKSVNISAEL
jgi:hypothetical protein